MKRISKLVIMLFIILICFIRCIEERDKRELGCVRLLLKGQKQESMSKGGNIILLQYINLLTELDISEEEKELLENISLYLIYNHRKNIKKCRERDEAGKPNL